VTQQQREACLLAAFLGRVATESEILNQVDLIATEAGNEIDCRWSEYCSQIAFRWNTHLGHYGIPLTTDDFANDVGRHIRDELAKILHVANSNGQKLALGETVGNIGKSAVLLRPLLRMGPLGLAIGIPVFLIVAASQIWNYILARLENPREELQTAISSSLASLGNRVGAEFEKEVYQRLKALHNWQKSAIREVAHRVVTERVGLL
jgi:hypothetical protein